MCVYYQLKAVLRVQVRLTTPRLYYLHQMVLCRIASAPQLPFETPSYSLDLGHSPVDFVCLHMTVAKKESNSLMQSYCHTTHRPIIYPLQSLHRKQLHLFFSSLSFHLSSPNLSVPMINPPHPVPQFFIPRVQVHDKKQKKNGIQKDNANEYPLPSMCSSNAQSK